MKEICEVKPWLYKIRGTNRRKWYTIILRKDKTFFCSCPSFKYGTQKCKHIRLLEMLV